MRSTSDPSATLAPIAELHDIRFSYDGGASWALDDVSLTIREGERICLTGPNGSGKSTLARLIAGLAAPDAGEVTLLGYQVFADAQHLHAGASEAGPDSNAYRAARRNIGVVFQNPEDQLVATTLEDDVAFGPENLGFERQVIGERIGTSLSAVGLAGHRHADPTRFSGGQQQRAAIAGMLAMNPHMMVLDEPTAMLDKSSQAEVMAILDALQSRGTAIVLVTHHPDETVHADRVLSMVDGRIVGIDQLTLDNHAGLARVTSRVSRHDTAAHDAYRQGVSESDAADAGHDAGTEQADDAVRMEENAAPGIMVNHLRYRYVGTSHTVFDDASLTVRPCETVALMGSNGSGKSTLAKLLCAFAKPDAGSISVAGVPVAWQEPAGRMHTATRRQLSELRCRVGYVMQHPERQLFAPTVADDVAFGPRNQGLGETETNERVAEALAVLHIEHLAERSPFDLSGGQQRLVAIAGVVACRPQVLIMDEPTASLDAAAKSRIHELMHTLHAQGVTILIITHDRAEAEAVADRILDIKQLAHSGTPTADDGPFRPATHPSDAPRAGDDVSASGDSTAHTASVNRVSEASDDSRRSWMQRLDPRAKMIGFLAGMFSMFAVDTPVQLAAAVLLTLAAILSARLNPIRVARAVHPILAMLVLMGILNLFVVHSGTPLITLGPFSVTDDAVRFAVLYTCRFALVIILGALFLTTTGPTAITDAFAALLSPLRRLGWHTQELSLVMSLALRFIPTLTDEALAIRDAQAARGGSIETGSLGTKARAMAAIVVPVFAGALRHADNLSLALDARCYEEGIRRTRWRVLAIRPRDIAFLACVVAWIAALAAF